MKVSSELLLQDLSDRNRAFVQQVRSWTTTLPPAALHWKAQPQRWSFLECLEHLNRYGDFYLPELERVVQFETVIHIFGRDRTDRVTQLATMLAHYDQLLSSLRKAVKDIAVASKVLHKRFLEQEQALAHPAWSPRRRRGSLQTTTTSEFTKP